MNKLQAKKKPSGKRPAIFYQPAYSIWSERLRIIYPSGKCEYISSFLTANEWALSCFQGRDFKSALKKANIYDRDSRWPEMEFLGDL